VLVQNLNDGTVDRIRRNASNEWIHAYDRVTKLVFSMGYEYGGIPLNTIMNSKRLASDTSRRE
jgi:hypothetical protein